MSLSVYFREQAAWRTMKVEDYPDDRRNLQSAHALASLADYIETGEAGSIVDVLTPHLCEGIRLGGPEANRTTSRYGFGYKVKRHHSRRFPPRPSGCVHARRLRLRTRRHP